MPDRVPASVGSDARTWLAVVVVLIVTGLLLIDQNMWLTVPIACLASIALAVIARRGGLSWQELGLGSAELRTGARWGLAAASIVAAGYLLVAVLPFGDAALSDKSVPGSAAAVAVKIAVVIPLRTVLLEELAFRGVLWALLRRRGTAMTATCWSAAAFGLWHIPAGLRVSESNQALEDLAGGSPLITAAVVLAVVVFTALAGIVFAELRRRSGSLLAPAGLHLATNGVGTVVSAIR